jgi:hypothetical protein
VDNSVSRITLRRDENYRRKEIGCLKRRLFQRGVMSRTVGPRLIHPPPPRPAILYVHGFLFAGWLLVFIVQPAFVRIHNVQMHRKLGWFGLAMGVAMLIVGGAQLTALISPLNSRPYANVPRQENSPTTNKIASKVHLPD